MIAIIPDQEGLEVTLGHFNNDTTFRLQKHSNNDAFFQRWMNFSRKL
jgi:hypothetical protein